MATKISVLTEADAGVPADGDLSVEVDVSDTTMASSGTDKRRQWKNSAGLTVNMSLHQLYGGL